MNGSIHRRFNTGSGATFLALPHQLAFEPGDHGINRVVTINLRAGMIFDCAVDIDHFFAVLTPFQNLVEQCPLALALDYHID